MRKKKAKKKYPYHARYAGFYMCIQPSHYCCFLLTMLQQTEF